MVRSSHNPELYRVLAIGRDVSQLSSGANVLTQAGYRADLVVTLDQAIGRVKVGKYHLAIVSSTFNCDEQIAIRARLKQARQNLPVLLMSSAHDSPDAFLAAVAESLKQKKSFQFGARFDELELDHDTKW
jgi:DNA-binding NtrC family response regulator